VELIRSLGADHVIDYAKEDFYWGAYKRVLNPEAKFVLVGAPKGNRILGPVGYMIKLYLSALGAKQKLTSFGSNLRCHAPLGDGTR
jgi:hypothetical protein